jgi:hypothetical protein
MSSVREKAEKALADLRDRLKAETPGGQPPVLPAVSQNDLHTCAMFLHDQLAARGVPYYFCGGFACINVAMTARTTADIDVAVPTGQAGLGQLHVILDLPEFVTDKEKYLSESPFFYVEDTGSLVEVDGIMAGFQAFPAVSEADTMRVGQKEMVFLAPAGLLLLKLSSWASKKRREGPKRNGDYSDATAIRELLIQDGKRVQLSKLKGDGMEGLKLWVQEFKDLKEWQKLDPGLRL